MAKGAKKGHEPARRGRPPLKKAKSPEDRMNSALHKEAVGENLAKARASLKITQSAFGKRYGIAQNKLNQWESGKYYPDPWFLKKLCEDYGFTTDWFYRGVMAGVSDERADGLRQLAEASEVSLADEGSRRS
jgi:transcriptional regulator with XRE-family HTH domain